MRKVTIPIYKYKELSEKAKEKALNTFREHNEMYYLEDNLKEELYQLLIKYEIDILNKCDILYSLSHSQRDGVCFVGGFKYDKYRIIIIHQGYYNNSNSVNIDIELYESYDEEGNEIIMSSEEETKIYNEFEQIYEEICNTIEKIGYDSIEYENSEEYIKDHFEANDLEFFADGSMY